MTPPPLDLLTVIMRLTLVFDVLTLIDTLGLAVIGVYLFVKEVF